MHNKQRIMCWDVQLAMESLRGRPPCLPTLTVLSVGHLEHLFALKQTHSVVQYGYSFKTAKRSGFTMNDNRESVQVIIAPETIKLLCSIYLRFFEDLILPSRL